MTIKIPRATDAGFGQRVPKTIPEYTPVPTTPKYVDDSDVGKALGEGITQLGKTLLNIGVQDREEQKRQREVEREKALRAQQAVEKSRASVELLTIQSEINTGVQEISNRFEATPAEKITAFEDYMKGMEEKYKTSIPPHLHPEFEPGMVAYALNTRSKFTDALSKQADDQLLADGARALALLETMAADSPDQRGAVKEQARAIIAALPLDEAKKVDQSQKFEAGLDTNEIFSRMNQTDKDGRKVGLGSLLADLENGTYTGLAPKETEKFVADVKKGIADEARQREQDRKAQATAFRERVKDTLDTYKEQKLAGLPVSAKEEDRIYKLTKGSEFEPRFLAIKSQGQSAAHVWEKLKEDPFTYGAARLGIQVKPLDVTSPEKLAQGIADNFSIGSRIKADLNMTYTPILPADTIKSLAGYIKKDVPAGVDFVDKLTRQLGNENMNGIAIQMAQTDPELATVVRYVAGGDTLTAKAVAKGQSLLESKALKMPEDNDLNSFFWSSAGSALKGLPNNAIEPYNAYKAAYANAAQVAGVQDGKYNEGLARIAFTQIVGQMAEHNGVKVVLPKDIKEVDFKNSVKRIDAGTVKDVGGVFGMKDEEAARVIRDDGVFYLAGDGVYRVLVNGLPMRTADQKRFVQFNIRSIDFNHPLSGVND